MSEHENEPFAVYLARWLVSRGYEPRYPQEAQPLVDAGMFVLSRRDGVNLELAVVRDRVRAGGPVSPPVFAAVAAGCSRYAGTVNGRQAPIYLTLYDVGPGAAAADNVAALSRLRREASGPDGIVDAFGVDPEARQVWSGRFLGGLLAGAPALKRLVSGPRRPMAPPRSAPPGITADERPARLTWAFLALLVAIFLVELSVGGNRGTLTPGLESLVILGGLAPPLVLEYGQWWRLVTATLLHGDAAHLLFNGVSALIMGTVLERLVGRAWLAGTFAVSALAGSLASLFLNPPMVVGIGASGGIVGLFAAALVIASRLPYAQMRQLRIAALSGVVPAVLPLLWAASGSGIDYGAHLGGAVAGAACGFAILALWPPDRSRPTGGRVAAGLAIAYALVAVGAIPAILSLYRLAAGLPA